VGSRDRRPAPSIFGSRSNVVHNQTGYLARPTNKTPETQIYFTTHRSGAFLVLRQRTVVRGERASRSIVNRTTGLWSIWMVSSLILAGPGILRFSCKRGGVKSEDGHPSQDSSTASPSRPGPTPTPSGTPRPRLVGRYPPKGNLP
jgi:hypothetical protein